MLCLRLALSTLFVSPYLNVIISEIRDERRKGHATFHWGRGRVKMQKKKKKKGVANFIFLITDFSWKGIGVNFKASPFLAKQIG
jgi:hypothetical protein